MVRSFHDGRGYRWILRRTAVYFHPDLDAVSRAVIAQLAQAFTDVLDGGIERRAARHAVGPHLDPQRARIVGQIHPFLSDFHLPAPLGRVRRLELARRAVAQQPHLAPLELRHHLLALVRRDRRLHAVLVLRA